MVASFKHIPAILLAGLVLPAPSPAQTVDLLSDGADAWQPFDEARWQFIDGELHGATSVFDGDKTHPAASTFLVSRNTFQDDFIVTIDITFDRGRYAGIYLDYSPDTQTGIWMASGHALAADAPDNEVERGYVKTIEQGFWIVRATGELVVRTGERIRLGFSRRGDDYSLWNDGKLIATYRRDGGYPPGHIQLRLTNAAVRIHRLQVRTGRGR